jgi:hypothetical protein
MSIDEELARIRLNEAIQEGLKSQQVASSRGSRRPSSWKRIAVVIGLAVLLAIFLALPGALGGL